MQHIHQEWSLVIFMLVYIIHLDSVSITSEANVHVTVENTSLRRNRHE
jgi:hypothetical protein